MIDPHVLVRQQAAIAARNGEKITHCLKCKTARIDPASTTGTCRRCAAPRRKRFRLFQGGAV